MRIKRTKTGPSGPDGQPTTTAVSWAKTVDVTGCVTLWVKGEANAGDFDVATIGQVQAQYANRPLAGTLEYLGDAEARRELKEALAQTESQEGWMAVSDNAKLAALQQELAAERDARRQALERIEALTLQNGTLAVEVAGLKEKLAASAADLEKATAPPPLTTPKAGPLPAAPVPHPPPLPAAHEHEHPTSLKPEQKSDHHRKSGGTGKKSEES